MIQKGEYFTVQEISEETKTYERFVSLVLEELTENRLIEKEGCLYRCDGIALEEIVKCK